MAKWLYRAGTFAARRAWAVLAAWILILVATAGAYFAWAGTLSSSFEVSDIESMDVIDELQESLPDSAGATGTIVVHNPDGPLTEGQEAQVAELAAGITELDDVATVTDPFAVRDSMAEQAAAMEQSAEEIAAGQEAAAAGAPGVDAEELEAQAAQLEAAQELAGYAEGASLISEDGSTALLTVSFTEPMLELADESREAVVEYVEDSPIDGAELVPSSDLSMEIPEIMGVGEVIGVAVAAVLLVVVLGSLIAASFPIITALMGVGIGAMATLSFSGVVQMASVTPILGVMLGLAVGIDYALFIINRHRRQLIAGADVRESIGLANGTAGTAVVFAGSTVILALLALNVVGIPFLGVMGSAGAASVLIAVLVAVTAAPALLGLAGEKVLGRKARAKRAAAIAAASDDDGATSGGDVTAEAGPSSGGDVRPMRTWRAIVTLVAGVAALAIVAIPALDMRLGLPTGKNEPQGSDAYEAYILTDEEFGEGFGGPLLVTADLPAGLDEAGIAAAQLDVARVLAAQDDVVAVAPIAVAEDGSLAAFQVVPSEGPSSESTTQLVHDLRDLPAVNGDIELGVAGQAAINIDISEGLQDALPLYLGLVVGLSFLIMMAVFRSLLVPLIATAGFVLSLLATLGVAVAVFQWGWLASLIGVHETGPLLSFLPVILVGVLFGLAMDYQLFLATGMREAYVHGAPARQAVAEGFRAGRRVVTTAALIMIAVFASFITSDSAMIKSFGVGMAMGVLLDAFVVRMLLVPAAMHLLGRSAWWLPRWLDKIVPNVDVEGASLERAAGSAPSPRSAGSAGSAGSGESAGSGVSAGSAGSAGSADDAAGDRESTEAR
ncbi:MAG: MMPL family transporter [Actinomycetaceae bacterium]